MLPEERRLSRAQLAITRRLDQRVLDHDQLAARLAVLLQPVGVDEVAGGIFGRRGDRSFERGLARPAVIGFVVDVVSEAAALTSAHLIGDEELRLADGSERALFAGHRPGERPAHHDDALLGERDLPQRGPGCEAHADHAPIVSRRVTLSRWIRWRPPRCATTCSPRSTHSPTTTHLASSTPMRFRSAAIRAAS